MSAGTRSFALCAVCNSARACESEKKRVAINLAPKVVCFTSIAINHLEWSPLAFGRLTCVHTFMDLSTKIMALGGF